jgi:hypothetical protein
LEVFLDLSISMKILFISIIVIMAMKEILAHSNLNAARLLLRF